MNGWNKAAAAAGLVLAAGGGAALAAVAHPQADVVAVQTTPRARAVEIVTGSTRIGVSIRDLTEADAKTVKGATMGVLIEDVSTGSPAEKAGARKGDVVVEFDGERVRSSRQLRRLVQETPPGRTVPLVVLRDGQRATLSVAPEEDGRFSFDGLQDLEELGRNVRARVIPRAPAPPGTPDRPFVWRFEDMFNGPGRLGITLEAVTGQLGEYFGAKEGVLVRSVDESSPAARAGIKAGDVITSFNGAAVNEPSDVRERVRALDEGGEFTVQVMRERKPLTLKGKIDPAESGRRRSPGRMVL